LSSQSKRSEPVPNLLSWLLCPSAEVSTRKEAELRDAQTCRAIIGSSKVPLDSTAKELLDKGHEPREPRKRRLHCVSPPRVLNQDQMSFILAKINLTAHASFSNAQCWTDTASSQLRVRFFQTSQLWCKDAAYNARRRERYANDPEHRQKRIAQSRGPDIAAFNATARDRYANDPEYRKRRLQAKIESYTKLTAIRRPEHIQKYLNDEDYRESMMEKNRARKFDREAHRQAVAASYKQNINNYAQKQALLSWILDSKWVRQLFWETHEPLIAEDKKIPALCASCKHVFTRRLWWRRKITDGKTGEQLLDCHKCFCDEDWQKALPLGYRGHVFNLRTRLKQPDWDNYPPSASSS
jgi:hypothetical protein